MEDTAAQEKRVEVEIFGEIYIVKGAEEQEYMKMLAQYVNKKMRQVVTRNPRLGIAKAAILTALNITDELMKLQKEYDLLLQVETIEEKRKAIGDKHAKNQMRA